MRINPFLYGLLVAAFFFGILFTFQATGYWATSGKTDSSGKTIQPSSADATTIKGWMTLEQVSTTYDIPVEEILTHFNIPLATAKTTTIKDLESDTFSVIELRAWLAEQ